MALTNIGDIRRVSAAFTNLAGAATDPTTVTLYVRKPGATSATSYVYGVGIVVVKDSTGAYHADLTLDTSGTWEYEWVGTGAVTAAEEGTFYVDRQVTRG